MPKVAGAGSATVALLALKLALTPALEAVAVEKNGSAVSSPIAAAIAPPPIVTRRIRRLPKCLLGSVDDEKARN